MKLCSGSALHRSIHQHCEQNRTGYKKKMMKYAFQPAPNPSGVLFQSAHSRHPEISPASSTATCGLSTAIQLGTDLLSLTTVDWRCQIAFSVP